MTNTTVFTLNQAAKEAGISKATVSLAIKKGRLSAHKKEDGSYEIQPAELFRVWPQGVRPNTGKQGKVNNSEPRISTGQALVEQAVLEAKLEASEEKNKLLESQLSDALCERDFRRIELEKEQAKTSQLMLGYDRKTTVKSRGPGAWILGVILLVLVAAVAVLFADRLGLISVLF